MIPRKLRKVKKAHYFLRLNESNILTVTMFGYFMSDLKLTALTEKLLVNVLPKCLSNFPGPKFYHPNLVAILMYA